MKKIFVLILIASVGFIISCQKFEEAPSFTASNGAFTATASATTVTPASKDSLSAAVTFTWTDPKFSIGLNNTKFSVFVDSAGKGFSNFKMKSFTGGLSGALLGKELNKMALQFHGKIGTPISLEMKVSASLPNNGEEKESAVIGISFTPYADVALIPSAESVVTTEANASSVGLTLNWNSGFSGYEGTRSYNIQYAQGGTSFASPKTVAVSGTSKSFSQLDLNNIASLDYGVQAGQVGNIDFRVQATNGQNITIVSNTVTVAVTPYSSKPVPKYPVPDNLYLVGDATPGSWSNPVPTPSQQFTRINDYTFGIILNLTGGNSYLLLPVNGDWSHKYNVSSGSANPAGDTFAPDAGSNNIPGPANSGLYKIIVDFVAATYTVTSVSSNPIPDNLYIVGDATPGSWSNPVSTPSQQFTQISNAEFQLTIPLTSTKSYLFLPVNGDWSHKYGGTAKLAGDLLVDGDVPGSNTPAPDADGTYLIDVNFLTMKYTLTKQ